MSPKSRESVIATDNEFDSDIDIIPPLVPSQGPFGLTSRQGSLVPDNSPTFAESCDPCAPKDKFNFVLLTFAFIGVINLMPMVFLLTATEYWMYKYRTIGSNDTNNATQRNYLQANYGSYNLIVITAVGILCNFVATFVVHKINLVTRAYLTLTFFPITFVVEAAMVKVNTDCWQVGFFALNLVIQALFSILVNISGTGIMTIVSKFPGHYMRLFLMGQGIGNLISAILRLITITIVKDTLGEAFLYFCTGCFLLTTGLVLFTIVTKTEFFRFYMKSGKPDERKRKIHSVKEIISQTKVIWRIILLGLLVYIIPIPSVSNLVVSEYKGTGNVWGDKYFVTVLTYFLPACGEIIGRTFSIKYDNIFSTTILFIILTTRSVVYGVSIMFTRAMPRTHLPIIFGHDWQYGIIMSTFSFTTGYLSNVVMLRMFKIISEEKYQISLLINMFFLSAFMGIASLFSLLMIKWL